VKRIAVISIILLFACFQAGAQFDKTVHDFGHVLTTDGELSCSFTFTNSSKNSMTITSVISSCGCTNVKWTREPIQPGGTGVVSAVYSNKDGAFPFDKALTVYFDRGCPPTVLHIKGSVHEKLLPIKELYPVHIGDAGVREAQIKVGNLRQGDSRSGFVEIANIGEDSITLAVARTADNLSATLDRERLAPGAVGHLAYTVSTDRSRWGKQHYFLALAVNGKVQKPELDFWTITIEYFPSMTKEQKELAPRLQVEQSTWTIQNLKKGMKVSPEFTIYNKGTQTLKIYAAQSEDPRLTVVYSPEKIEPGESSTVKLDLDTKKLEKGEQTFIVTLYTNSPSRPMAKLFVTGYLK